MTPRSADHASPGLILRRMRAVNNKINLLKRYIVQYTNSFDIAQTRAAKSLYLSVISHFGYLCKNTHLIDHIDDKTWALGLRGFTRSLDERIYYLEVINDG